MLSRFFKPVPTWDMARAKAFIDAHKLEAYTLLDVRQPAEFEEGHLPGAVHIPVGELEGRLAELPKDKPTLVYCRSGGRAGNATAQLVRAGFGEVHNSGGLPAWRGLVATGAPAAAMAIFDEASTPAEHVALAYQMEEGARRFYLELGGNFADLAEPFSAMAEGEARHRDLLGRLYGQLGGEGEPALKGAAGLVEGGISLEEALAWCQTREAVDVLELAATMEANAHDRYVHVGRAVGGATREAFFQLAEAERVHMDQLLAAFEERL